MGLWWFILAIFSMPWGRRAWGRWWRDLILISLLFVVDFELEWGVGGWLGFLAEVTGFYFVIFFVVLWILASRRFSGQISGRRVESSKGFQERRELTCSSHQLAFFCLFTYIFCLILLWQQRSLLLWAVTRISAEASGVPPLLNRLGETYVDT